MLQCIGVNKHYLIKIAFMYYLAFITCIISIGATIYQMTVIFDSGAQIYRLIIPMLGIYYSLIISASITHDWDKAVKKFSDRNASIAEILIGSAVVILTSIVCRYYFKLHWTLILSICVIYVVGIHRLIRKYFMPENNKEE